MASYDCVPVEESADYKIYLMYLSGASRREIADKLGLSYGGVCNRIRRMIREHNRGKLPLSPKTG